MTHPKVSVLDRDGLISDLSNLPMFDKYLFVLNGEPLQEVVKSVIKLFNSSVALKCSSFRKCKYSSIFWDIYVE